MLKIMPKPAKSETKNNHRIKYLIGVDVSITCTGIAIVDNMRKLVKSTHIKPITKTLADHTRIDEMVSQFFDFVNPTLESVPSYAIKFVFEAYAFGRFQGKMFSRAELAGILKHELRKSDYDIVACSPTALKKATTGKGNIKGKDAMMQAVFANYGAYTQNDDEADAIACAMYGYRVFIEHEALDITRQNTFNPQVHR